MLDYADPNGHQKNQDSSRDLEIERIVTTILNLPIRRPHQLSAVTLAHQSVVLVEIHTRGGLVGYGEGVTPGGPWWSGESVETIKAMIDFHITPILIGMRVDNLNLAYKKISKAVAKAPFAKGAVEIGLQDAAAKAQGLPLFAKFGGRVQEGIDVRWALASGNIKTDIAEAQDLIERDIAHAFKIKGGVKLPAQELEYAKAIRAELGDDVSIQIDLNSVWSLSTALKYGPRIMEYVDYLEQPVESWNHKGLAALRRVGCKVMADESVYSVQDAMSLVELQAVDILALKPMKMGGLAQLQRVAHIAEAAGIAVYAGTFMESSLGACAQLHVAQTLPNLTEGGELFSGLWLAEDICEKGLEYRGGKVFSPEGLGHGIIPDSELVHRFKRD